MLGFPGNSLPRELADYLAQGLAGVVIYKRNFASVEQLLDLTAAIRESAGRPVLIGIDQEGGTRFALERAIYALAIGGGAGTPSATRKQRKKLPEPWPWNFARRDAILISRPCWTCSESGKSA